MKPFTQFIPTRGIGQLIEDTMEQYSSQRRPFERKWYDNNFFDDGLHFRYLSKQSGRVIDLGEKAQTVAPMRAIPKASRQLRGVANLLLALEPHPSIYPQEISRTQFMQFDPASGQQIFNQESYNQSIDQAKYVAQRIGHWVEEEWEDLRIKELLIQMVLLTGKHGVSFMEIWPDYMKKKVCAEVWDAFDIYLPGNLTDIYKAPSIIKAVPTPIAEIKANELFDEEQRMSINPDNRFASSEVKEAYMKSRFGRGDNVDSQQTLILKEAFIKEYISEDNLERVKQSDKENGVLEGKNKGDQVMRHVFSTTNGWLLDEYIDLEEYPFVDYRMEPGPIYQVPLIERFIPANKSLDIAMSRIEGWMNTMVLGIWANRKGENFRVSNIPGGQRVEYETIPPTQIPIGNLPSAAFNFLSLLQQNIEEQGAATAALGQIPEGVRSARAIESIKATEYSNLKIPTDMFKDTVRRITERMIEVASKNYLEPRSVMRLEDDQPDYFKVIGEKGAKNYEKAGLGLADDVIVIRNRMKVRIAIESGLGYTVDGKKDTMAQIVQYVTGLAKEGLVNPEAVKVLTKKFLEIFQFGSTQEFMEAMDAPPPIDEAQDERDIEKTKVAVAEAMKDMGLIGAEKDEQDIDKSKIALLEASQDLVAGVEPNG